MQTRNVASKRRIVVDTLHMESEDQMTAVPHGHGLARERYRSLQRQSDACRKEAATFETVCVGGVLAAYAWIARDADHYVAPNDLVWFLPPVAAFYGALRSQALALRQARLQRDVDRLEQEAGLAPLAPRTGARRRWIAHRLAWIAFFALTVLASVTGFEGGMVGADNEDDDGQAQTMSRTRAAVGAPMRLPIRLPIAAVDIRG